MKKFAIVCSIDEWHCIKVFERGCVWVISKIVWCAKIEESLNRCVFDCSSAVAQHLEINRKMCYAKDENSKLKVCSMWQRKESAQITTKPCSVARDMSQRKESAQITARPGSVARDMTQVAQNMV